MIPIPIILLAISAASSAISALYSAYSTDKATEQSDRSAQYQADYSSALYSENETFWADYIRRHHLEGRTIKYPYRTGLVPNMSALYGAEATLTTNDILRSQAWANAGSRVVSAGASTGAASGVYSQYRNRPIKDSDISRMYG